MHTVTDSAGTVHTTNLYTHESPVRPRDLVDNPDHQRATMTWWGWTCTCGDGGDGYGPMLAADLAYTHRERNTPCTCGNPTITTLSTSPSAVCELSCDCGFFKVARQEPGWSTLQPWLRVITRTLADHSCGTSVGPLRHSCHKAEPTYVTAS